MDNAAQNQNPSADSGQVPQSQTQPVQPMQPVGSSTQKESGPQVQQTEFIKPTEQAPKISPELQKAGVEHSPDANVPKLTLEDKKAGLGLAKEHVQVSTEPSGSIKLPMSQQQAKQALHKRISDSVKWLALLVLRQLKKQTVGKL